MLWPQRGRSTWRAMVMPEQEVARHTVTAQRVGRQLSLTTVGLPPAVINSMFYYYCQSWEPRSLGRSLQGYNEKVVAPQMHNLVPPVVDQQWDVTGWTMVFTVLRVREDEVVNCGFTVVGRHVRPVVFDHTHRKVEP